MPIPSLDCRVSCRIANESSIKQLINLSFNGSKHEVMNVQQDHIRFLFEGTSFIFISTGPASSDWCSTRATYDVSPEASPSHRSIKRLMPQHDGHLQFIFGGTSSAPLVEHQSPGAGPVELAIYALSPAVPLSFQLALHQATDVLSVSHTICHRRHLLPHFN
jgi:hypothetical protein